MRAKDFAPPRVTRRFFQVWQRNFRIILVDKTRQLYVSYLLLLLSGWYGAFYDEREIVVSKVKAEDAIKLINDKIRDTFNRLPGWVQEALGMEQQPQDIIKFGQTRSTITGVAQNFAFSSARGITGSLIVVDEAAYQPYFTQILQAVLPMSVRLWAVTTANLGNPGALTFKERIFVGRPAWDGEALPPAELDPDPNVSLAAGRATEIETPVRGMLAYTSPRGDRVIVLKNFVDPAHDASWEKEERRKYNSRDWRREQENDWSTPSGAPYIPEFGDIGKDKFIRLVERLIPGPVFRSYDFGRRRPACTWFQYHPGEDRMWGYREFMPHDLQTHEFRDAVRYFSGEIEYAELPPRAQRWVDIYAAKPSCAHCPPPWFPPGTRFVDLTGKEALQGTAHTPTKEEGSAMAIFAEKGIYLNWWSGFVEARYKVLQRLLRLYKDGYPGLLLDPQMEEVAEAMDGALAYPAMSAATPIPTKPADDGHFINLMDALTYGAVMVIPVDAPQPGKKREPRVLQGAGGRQEILTMEPDIGGFGFYENRGREI